MTGDPYLDQMPDHDGCAGQIAAAAAATVVAGLAWARWGVGDAVASLFWLGLAWAMVAGLRYTWRQEAARRAEYDLINGRRVVGELLEDRRPGGVA